jgi:hypothetical protein
MTAWILIVHLVTGYEPLLMIPGIASQQECERLNDVLIQKLPHNMRAKVVPGPGGRSTANDADCLSYEMAPNDKQARHSGAER